MRVAILTTDARDMLQRYNRDHPDFGTAPQALFQGFAQLPGLEVHVVSCTRQPLRSPSRLAENIWFHTVVVPRLGWLRTGYQGCIRAVRAKLHEIHPDIVHGQGTERDCAMSAVWSGSPNIVTLHGIMRAQAQLIQAQVGSFYWCAARLERHALARTAGVFCNSAYTESLIKSFARRTWRVANALREEFFSPLPTSTLHTPPILLNIGLICPRKRQLELLRMAGELFADGTAGEIHFVGALATNDSYGRAFQEELQKAEARGYARYCGQLSAPQLLQKLDESTALIHFPTEEAFGVVVAEALARNVKLFAARVGGIVDIAQDIPDAELFATDDLTGLRCAIGAWLGQGAPRPNQCASQIRERYHPLTIARRHVEIYQQVLEG